MSSPKILNESHNNSTLSLKVGDAIKIYLPGNASTGYMWARKGYTGKEQLQNPSCNHLKISKTYRSTSCSQSLCGAGGTTKFTVTPLHPGNHELVLVYIRPWVPESSEKTFTLYINSSA